MSENLKNRIKDPATTAPLLVLFVLTAMYLSRYSLVTLESETNIFVALGVIQLAVLALPCIVYYLLKGRKLATPILFVSKTGPQLLFVLFAAMFFISGMLLIKFFYFVGGGSVAPMVNYYGDYPSSADGVSKIQVILSLIVIPAVCEELFFRGIVLSEYRCYGTANAVIVSALCFAMLHFSFESFFVYLFTGLLFGFVTAVSRSIIPSIALHLLSNTLSIFASDAFLRVTVVKNGAYFVGFVLFVLAGVSLVLMLSRVESICYTYAQKPPLESIPPKSRSFLGKVFFSPSFMLLIVLFVCFTIFI